MNTHTGDARPAARLTILSGPSGVGRNRVVELVRARSPVGWHPVPVTTRPRGEGEVDGVHYQFVDRTTFQQMTHAGQLLEWAELAGRWYGTPRAPVESRLRAGDPVLLCLDLAGARQVREAMPGVRLLLLVPPGWRDTEVSTDVSDDTMDVVDDTVVVDSLLRAVDELVGLLGSPALL